MSDLFQRICQLIDAGDVRISAHGYDEMSQEGIAVRDLISSTLNSTLVEDYPDYPDYPKGPCALVLHFDAEGQPIHVVWGIPKGYDNPVVLVTAYRPDPERWDETFLKRRS
ncbi:MAG: DUF4258 domain-containing protein [Planctomycetaceae bacterium]